MVSICVISFRVYDAHVYKIETLVLQRTPLASHLHSILMNYEGERVWSVGEYGLRRRASEEVGVLSRDYRLLKTQVFRLALKFG